MRGQTPNTVVSLAAVAGLLRQRGYSETDVEGIMHGNWIRLFREAWS